MNTRNYSVTLPLIIDCNARDSTILSPNPAPHVGIFIVSRCKTKESDTRRAFYLRHMAALRCQRSVSVCTRFNCERLWTRTWPGNTILQLETCLGENVYLCPCFCDSPVTRPGNCKWLPWWAATFIFDPFGSHRETVAVLKDTRRSKDLSRLVLLAGTQAISSDATQTPPRPLMLASFFNRSNAGHKSRSGASANRKVSIHRYENTFCSVFWCTPCSLALVPTLHEDNRPEEKQHSYDLNRYIFSAK